MMIKKRKALKLESKGDLILSTFMISIANSYSMNKPLILFLLLLTASYMLLLINEGTSFDSAIPAVYFNTMHQSKQSFLMFLILSGHYHTE